MARIPKNNKKIDFTYDSVIVLLKELYSELEFERRISKDAISNLSKLIKDKEDQVMLGKNYADVIKNLHSTNEGSLDIINTITNVLKYKDKKEEEENKAIKSANIELTEEQKKKIIEMNNRLKDIKSSIKKNID
jgi:putative protein kinase ArgK-like GTPase of G3E family